MSVWLCNPAHLLNTVCPECWDCSYARASCAQLAQYHYEVVRVWKDRRLSGLVVIHWKNALIQLLNTGKFERV